MRVEDVSPILDIASRANKHLKKAKRVVEYWRGAHAGKFPVKVTVPIMMTVYATIDFRNFRAAAEADEDDARPPRNKTKDEHKKDERRMDAPADFSAHTPSDPAYFEVPPGYARKTLVQALREAEEEERRQLEAEARARKAKREEAQKLPRGQSIILKAAYTQYLIFLLLGIIHCWWMCLASILRESFV